MKKSQSIKLGFVSLFSVALLAGCTSPEQYTQRCVDKNDKLQDDSNCRAGGSGRWIYMGSHSSVSNGIVSGYHASQPSTGRISSSSGSTIRSAPSTRGGFGSSGSHSFGS
jgi:hypothetical protein